MDTKQNPARSLQDEHLDFLIRLAYRREAERRLLDLTENAQNDSFSEEIPACETGYIRFCEKRDALLKDQRKSARIRRIKSLSRTVGKIAAALILCIAVAVPIAVAAIEPVRVQLMELLIDIQDDYTRLSLKHVGGENRSVPDEWMGEYFPMYLPDGMEFHYIDEVTAFFLLRNSGGQYVEFFECAETEAVQVNTENAHISYEFLNNVSYFIAERGDDLTIVWSDNQKYFVVISNLPKQEILRIAGSVLKIND